MIGHLAFALAAALLSAQDAGPGWEKKAEGQGVTIYSRAHPGSDVKEIRAVGEVDAPPLAVLRVVSDFSRYKDVMPYTEESKVLLREDGGKVVHFYTVINAPFVSRRDYSLRVVDESDWKGGQGFLKVHWTLSDKGPAPKNGNVRVKVNEGGWLLEPLDGGKRTRATYLLFTDPGGTLPTWIINKANSSAIPDIFAALRKESAPRTAGK